MPLCHNSFVGMTPDQNTTRNIHTHMVIHFNMLLYTFIYLYVFTFSTSSWQHDLAVGDGTL